MRNHRFSFNGLLTVLCLVILGVSSNAYTWSAQGHSAISVAAFEQLDVKTQKDFNAILSMGPWSKKKQAQKNSSLVSLASNWPDWIRDKTITQIFSRYGSGQVPKALESYAGKTTRNWHYVNALFLTQDNQVVAALAKGSAGKCPPEIHGELFNTWPLLFSAYQNSSDSRDKALLLAFILHFGADAYQPLHVLSALDQHCQHDRGGNGYCVEPDVGLHLGYRGCKQNMHQVWDSGFGFFEQAKYSIKSGAFKGDIQDLRSVLLSLRAFVPDVYPTQAQQVSALPYQNKAKRIVAQTSGLGVAHLLASLTFLENK